jgi:hypothetical protein
MRHLHQAEIVHGPVMALGARLAAGKHLVNREPHVLIGGEPRQQRVVLEHDAAVRPRLVHFAILEQDHSRGRRKQPGDDVEQGRLAATGMADDGNELAAIELQRNLVEHFGRLRAALEALADQLDGQIGLRHCWLHQLAAVPRVTALPAIATTRSSTKPIKPT